MNSLIFRNYDIRGSAVYDIKPDLAYKIGFCFAIMHITKDNNNICVGRDGRNSSLELYYLLSQGILDAGAQVINIGLVTTPLLYFADLKFKSAASIMITASHNPKDDNGFKMLTGNKPFFGDKIQNLYYNIKSTPVNIKNITHNSVEIDLTDEYLERVTQGLVFNPNLKIAWDPGNGSACDILKALQNKMPCAHFMINSKIDGNFSGRSPDPTALGNLNQLIRLVKDNQCNVGIAFDGDADRLSIITDQGRIIAGDQLLCLFARDILKHYPNRAVVMDMKSSQILFNQITYYNGTPIMCKTGHVFVKEKMQETNAILGGEISGHLFFADKYYGYDDGIYAALRLIDLLSRSKTSLEEMLKELPIAYSSPEIRVSIAEEKKFIAIIIIKKYLIKNKIKFDDIDGVKVSTDNGWWLIRASNTESKLTIRYEATSLGEFKKIKLTLKILLQIVKSVKCTETSFN